MQAYIVEVDKNYKLLNVWNNMADHSGRAV
jgi:hypothetical protein